MKKVLLTADIKGSVGGINIWAKHIYDYYISLESPNIELITIPTGRDDFTKFTTSKFKRILDGARVYSSYVLKIYKLFRENRYDVIHITSSGSYGLFRDYVLIKLAHRFSIKAIVHFHFGRIPAIKHSNGFEWKGVKQVAKIADSVIVLDQHSFDCLTGVTNSLFKIPNPISPHVLQYVDRSNYRRKHNVLFVGQCYKEKGIFDLCEACQGIPNITLDIIGSISDETKEILSQKYDGLNLNIHGIKPYDFVLAEMMSCAVFALPSYSEGFPNVILEAMACGCNIVASNVGAIPEMLNSEALDAAGIVIPSRNILALREAIVALLNDYGSNSQFSKIARQRVISEYSIAPIWSKLEQIWQDINPYNQYENENKE